MRAKIEEKLTAAGITGPGRDWVIKALDPASPGPGPGVPDASTNNVLRPEYRIVATIEPPGGASTWDCIIWIPPGDLNALCWAAGPAPCDFTLPPSSIPTGVSFGCIQLTPWVDLHGYTTTWSASFGANFNLGTRLSATAGAAFRHQYKSVTIECVAPDISNQGEVYAGQFPTVPRAAMITNVGAKTNPGGAYIGTNAVYVPLPLDENSLTATCRNAYVGKAREGVYIPLRHMELGAPFARPRHNIIGNFTVTSAGNSYPYTGFIAPTFSNVQSSLLVPTINTTGGPIGSTGAGMLLSDSWITGSYTSTGANAACDLSYDSMNTGVVIFRGLAGSSGGGGGPAFSCVLNVKVLAGLEVICTAQSTDRVYEKPAALYNPRALEAYMSLVAELPPAFPSSYNSLGLLMPVLSGLASRLWPALKMGGHALASGVAEMLKPDEEKIVVREREAPRALPPPPKPRAPSVVSRVSVKSALKKRPGRRKAVPR